MPRRALICGVSGQDGAYLAQFLLSKGCEVWGTSRATATNEFSSLKKLGLLDKVCLRSMNPEDFQDVLKVISEVQPDELYNLSGQSSVGLSFDAPHETTRSILNSALNQLEAIRTLNHSIRFFNAGSGECFGDIGLGSAVESCSFNPQSPYAAAKAAAHWQVKVYREAYGLFTCSGFLFNHESPLRPERFVTQKIVTAARRIADGSDEILRLGNLEIQRDWGWAPEFVEAMWRMLNCETPQDFVIATGVTQSLKEFIRAVFEEAGLDWERHVKSDPSLFRATDPECLVGSPEKARKILGWEPKVMGEKVPKRMYHQKSSSTQ